MPRLRFSRVVWLILLSQALSLAVVSTALWDFRKDIGVSPISINQTISQFTPDTLTRPSSADLNRPRPTVLPPRIIGETNRILDCISNALLARRLAARQLAGIIDASEEHIECEDPDLDKQPGKEYGPPGGK